jgi:hypothetical protein
VSVELQTSDESVAGILLEELLRLELEHRRRAGEQPQPTEYRQRFPALDPDWLTAAGPATLAGPPAPARSPEPVPATVVKGPVPYPGRCVRGDTGEVYGVAWSPDGTRLAGAGHGGPIEVWDATPRAP